MPYDLDIIGVGDDGDLKTALGDVSVLKRLQQEPPVDGLDLVRRAEADLPKLTDLLWGEGYYSAKVTVEVAGERLFLHGERQLAAARAAERARGSRIVPVRVIVASGPRYAFRSVVVRTDKGRDAGDVPTKLYHHLAGAPAASASIVEAATRIGAHYRKLGHPFASIEDPEPVIDHASRSVDVVLVVRPGARANIGAVHVSGADGIDAGVIRSFIYADGEMLFSPERMTEIRRSVARIEAVGSVRVQPRDKLDGDGTVPVDVQVGVRPRHVLGGSARYSNVDGPGIGLYWADRNMFGGAERLRLGADLFYLPNTYSRAWRNRFETNNLGGRLEAGFLKPALGGSRVDFLADAALSRAATEAYVSRIANVTAALRYRFADKTWVQAGAMAEFGQTQDVFGRLTYQLVGLPLSANWDTTDNDLDPTRGFRLSGSVMAAYGAGDIGRFFAVSKAQASAYYALDQDARVILAGRVGLGAASGASVSEIPANWRFFAGGGGSVRGYEYRSIGPRDTLGRLVGGRSLFEASLEARIRATETIGIVPFVDVGAAFSSAAPSFDETLRFGLGVGLRYHTAIGPIRVDVATPLDRRRGEKPVALYISLGQAF